MYTDNVKNRWSIISLTCCFEYSRLEQRAKLADFKKECVIRMIHKKNPSTCFICIFECWVRIYARFHYRTNTFWYIVAVRMAIEQKHSSIKKISNTCFLCIFSCWIRICVQFYYRMNILRDIVAVNAQMPMAILIYRRFFYTVTESHG